MQKQIVQVCNRCGAAMTTSDDDGGAGYGIERVNNKSLVHW